MNSKQLSPLSLLQGVALLLLLILPAGSANGNPAPDPTPTTTSSALPVEDGPEVIGDGVVYIDELPPLPPYVKDAPFPAKVDWVHDRLFLRVQRRVEKMDSAFVPELGLKERVPISHFRLGVFGEFQKEDTNHYEFDPEFDMDLNLPNLEKQFKIFITTEELDELPSTDPTEEDRQLRLGVRQGITELIDVEAGVRVKWIPEIFGRMKISRKWHAGQWQVYPGMSGFWESDEGFGTKGSLTWDRWAGRRLFRTVSGARWTEETDGVEWDQSVLLGYFEELLEEHKLGRRARGRDLARGGGLRYTVSGHDDAETVLDRHRVTLFYKFPIYRQWLYGVVAPELKFVNERNWDTEPGVKVGLDMLFWGMGGR